MARNGSDDFCLHTLAVGVETGTIGSLRFAPEVRHNSSRSARLAARLPRPTHMDRQRLGALRDVRATPT